MSRSRALASCSVIALAASLAACSADTTHELVGAAAGPLAGTSRLNAGENLYAGQSISSGSTSLVYQSDNHLVLYRDGAPIWATYAGIGAPTSRFAMQTDCNAVVYSANGYVWHASTYGQGSSCYAQVIDGDWFICSGPNRVWSARGGGHCDGGAEPPPPLPPPAPAPPDRSLSENLERLFESWRARNRPDLGSCAAWEHGLDETQRMVFLTITHRLHTGRLGSTYVNERSFDYSLFREYVADGRQPLDHVTKIYAIRGAQALVPRGGGSANGCGGGEYNRVFMSIDHNLWLAFVLARSAATNGGPGPLVDPSGHRAWGASHDLMGPHGPFNMSSETIYGSPRGQTHFFGPMATEDLSAYVSPAYPRSTGRMSRPGVEGVDDPYLLEMDQDYNLVHDSNPMCGDFLNQYVNNHGRSGPQAIDLDWMPRACSTPVSLGNTGLVPGQSLAPNQAVFSPDGRFRLTYQGDGNLVLYQGGAALWSSGTSGTSVGSTVMSGDGNLLVLDANGGAVWSSGTGGNNGAYLSVQSDGNVVVYSRSAAALWHTHTCCR